jgi:multisubunit Na+/H+ antiporter MnhG subunit
VAALQVAVHHQFGNLLAVTVCVQTLTATWVVDVNTGKFVTLVVLAVAAAVILHLLCNAVVGKAYVKHTHGKVDVVD